MHFLCKSNAILVLRKQLCTKEFLRKKEGQRKRKRMVVSTQLRSSVPCPMPAADRSTAITSRLFRPPPSAVCRQDNHPWWGQRSIFIPAHALLTVTCKHPAHHLYASSFCSFQKVFHLLHFMRVFYLISLCDCFLLFLYYFKLDNGFWYHVWIFRWCCHREEGQ